ncbi:MAG: DUF1398 domain-containing protein [Rhizobiales bacterium]|nr:DUF1398 domain-containing protein [Hyphomicrobiales bacterium]
MDKNVIGECTRMSFAGVAFPDVVKRLATAGVGAYRADLIRLQVAYYDHGRDSYDSTLPLEDGPPVGTEFVEADVVAAVRAIQCAEISYAEFLRRIMRAGCASYSVFIAGRKAMYFGRDGQFCVENFPQRPQ